MHILLLPSNMVVMFLAWVFYCKKKNYFIVLVSSLLTISLINFLKTLVQKYIIFKHGLDAWMFPAYELIIPVVFYGMLLRPTKYIMSIIIMLALTILLLLYGYQTFETLLYNCLLSVSLLIFFTAIEKTFLIKHCYLVFISIAICIIPSNFGYYTLSGIACFWAITISYPLGHLIDWMNRVYFSSLRSKIS
ncbi:MAG: hypothetical protein P8L77_05460 [Gammaproteobacteria bacterium]|nr:hypothetical protein [Gammaproteobacteria bacterium]